MTIVNATAIFSVWFVNLAFHLSLPFNNSFFFQTHQPASIWLFGVVPLGRKQCHVVCSYYVCACCVVFPCFFLPLFLPPIGNYFLPLRFAYSPFYFFNSEPQSAVKTQTSIFSKWIMIFGSLGRRILLISYQPKSCRRNEAFCVSPILNSYWKFSKMEFELLCQ